MLVRGFRNPAYKTAAWPAAGWQKSTCGIPLREVSTLCVANAANAVAGSCRMKGSKKPTDTDEARSEAPSSD